MSMVLEEDQQPFVFSGYFKLTGFPAGDFFCILPADVNGSLPSLASSPWSLESATNAKRLGSAPKLK